MTDEFERDEHGLECECSDCIPHDSDCPCSECYERLVIESDRQRADWIWEANQRANDRMAILVGLDELEGEK